MSSWSKGMKLLGQPYVRFTLVRALGDVGIRALETCMYLIRTNALCTANSAFPATEVLRYNTRISGARYWNYSRSQNGWRSLCRQLPAHPLVRPNLRARRLLARRLKERTKGGRLRSRVGPFGEPVPGRSGGLPAPSNLSRNNRAALLRTMFSSAERRALSAHRGSLVKDWRGILRYS